MKSKALSMSLLLLMSGAMIAPACVITIEAPPCHDAGETLYWDPPGVDYTGYGQTYDICTYADGIGSGGCMPEAGFYCSWTDTYTDQYGNSTVSTVTSTDVIVPTHDDGTPCNACYW